MEGACKVQEGNIKVTVQIVNSVQYRSDSYREGKSNSVDSK